MVEANGGAVEALSPTKRRALVSVLCNRLSLDQLELDGNDVKTLFSNILELLKKKASPEGTEEVKKWIEFGCRFLDETQSRHKMLKDYNEEMAQRSVILGDGLKPSDVDVVVFCALHSYMIGLSSSEMMKFPNVVRWMDYIQCKEDFGEAFEKIKLARTGFQPHYSRGGDRLEVDRSAKKCDPEEKEPGRKTDAEDKKKTLSEGKKKSQEKEPVEKEKKKTQEREQVEKDLDVNITALNIQVGLIRKAWRHPGADSLLVEEIDMGDGSLRQVVSGLAKYYSPEDLLNRYVLVVTNVKPGKLRDVMSSGLVLCASNEDHNIVEPLLLPKEAKIGDRVSFAGYEGKPEDVLNPKKKQLEKITPHLYTDGKGIATFKGVPFMTSAGPCTSSLVNATIK
ncbi:probable methionine--tRNA ligase isoform X2 [Amborella trichopoda]|uniref:tRNA-binding domain-containing protein n=1 Tax=Amborella trichopoda TaxID=13333 RepID=W1P940_AMBTC|nr:probable methionine--tRNA ligase isoform X2 [Amborella trichopoda]ERN04169.1 hypothetical protein AMTR_s00077p00092950 [Amborella trichopoda]|eukprot:XP_006842494.1 probable methionine--tRNA ligase isoform X2 [Amborella trichopoda]